LTGSPASVNPARSRGPALFAGGKALSQLWLFLVVPSICGIVAGWLFRVGVLEAVPGSTAGIAKAQTGD